MNLRSRIDKIEKQLGLGAGPIVINSYEDIMKAQEVLGFRMVRIFRLEDEPPEDPSLPTYYDMIRQGLIVESEEYKNRPNIFQSFNKQKAEQE